MKRSSFLLVLAVPMLLGGCQTIKSHNPFRHRAPDYQAAQQVQSLEIPPGLDRPATSQALTIPAASASASAPATATAGSHPPPAIEAAPEQTGADAATTRDTLTLSDTPANAYHRVGLALARGDVGQVTAHDDAARTYQVTVNTTVKSKSEGGFLHRLFHRKHKQSVRGSVTVSVAPANSGSVIGVSGAAAAVAQVMSVLRRRLKP